MESKFLLKLACSQLVPQCGHWSSWLQGSRLFASCSSKVISTSLQCLGHDFFWVMFTAIFTLRAQWVVWTSLFMAKLCHSWPIIVSQIDSSIQSLIHRPIYGIHEVLWRTACQTHRLGQVVAAVHWCLSGNRVGVQTSTKFGFPVVLSCSDQKCSFLCVFITSALLFPDFLGQSAVLSLFYCYDPTLFRSFVGCRITLNQLGVWRDGRSWDSQHITKVLSQY